MNYKITASIVIYKNEPQVVMRAVESFLRSVQDSVLFLIDNSPVPHFAGHFTDKRVRYIFNNRNMGFGAAHNIALKEVISANLSAYHLVLNPDIFFGADVIANMEHFMDENSSVALAMPKVLYPDGTLQPLCRLLPSPVTLFSRRFLRFHSARIDKINHWYELQFSGYNKIMDVPFLSGCFMFLRTDALRKVGLFDERIFLYTEDTDLSRRLHQHFRTVFYPYATIYHVNEKASYKNTRTMLQHMKSAITYFNKWGWFLDTERKAINQNVLLKLTQL